MNEQSLTNEIASVLGLIWANEHEPVKLLLGEDFTEQAMNEGLVYFSSNSVYLYGIPAQFVKDPLGPLQVVYRRRNGTTGSWPETPTCE